MTALAADRNTAERAGQDYSGPVAANVVIYAGALICLDAAGNMTPGATATTLVAAGRADERVDNTGGAAGALTVRWRRGLFRWANSAGADEITRAEVGDTAYIVDDQTVAKTDGTSTRSAAGIIRDVDDVGVWIET